MRKISVCCFVSFYYSQFPKKLRYLSWEVTFLPFWSKKNIFWILLEICLVWRKNVFNTGFPTINLSKTYVFEPKSVCQNQKHVSWFRVSLFLSSWVFKTLKLFNFGRSLVIPSLKACFIVLLNTKNKNFLKIDCCEGTLILLMYCKLRWCVLRLPTRHTDAVAHGCYCVNA